MSKTKTPKMKATKEPKPKKITIEDKIIQMLKTADIHNAMIKENKFDIDYLISELKKINKKIDLIQDQNEKKGIFSKLFKK